jgi:hypothetical protein
MTAVEIREMLLWGHEGGFVQTLEGRSNAQYAKYLIFWDLPEHNQRQHDGYESCL